MKACAFDSGLILTDNADELLFNVIRANKERYLYTAKVYVLSADEETANFCSVVRCGAARRGDDS